MAKQIISAGTSANDHTGDSLRTATAKINSNFTELYNAIGASGIQGASGPQGAAGATGPAGAGSSIDLSAIDQSIIPDTDVAYDLGSITNRFKDLYLSGNTINLGGSTISNIGGGIVFSTAPGVQTSMYDVTGWQDYGNNIDIAIGQTYTLPEGSRPGPYLDGAVPSIRYAFGNEPAVPATWTFTYDGGGYIESITLDSAGDPIEVTDQFEFLWYPAPSTPVTPRVEVNNPPGLSSYPIASTDTIWDADGKSLYVNRDYLGFIVSISGSGWTGADVIPGQIGGRICALVLPDGTILDGRDNGPGIGHLAVSAEEDCFTLSFFIVATQPHINQAPSVSSVVPAHSIGAPGDVKGNMASDANYFYYCVMDYDGTSDIWKRLGWSLDTW